MAEKIDVSSSEEVQGPKRSKPDPDDRQKKLKLAAAGTAAVETAATSCGKGGIEIKACSSDGGWRRKKIGASNGKTIGARRSGDDVGRSRTSGSNDRRSSSVDFLPGCGVAANDDADLLPSSGRRRNVVGIVGERQDGGGGQV